MAHLKPFDVDKQFDNLSIVPFIANELSLETDEDKENFNRLVYTHYDGESLKLTPTCQCGNIKGQYQLGVMCPTCKTICSNKYSGKIESLVWILPPKGISKFIMPVFWNMITTAYRIGQVDVIRYLCDPRHKLTARVPNEVLALFEKGHKRGYQYFIDNFYQIIDDLTIRPNGKVLAKHKDTYELIQMYRDKIFAKALPIPSKTVLVLEKNKSARYFDKSLYPVIDAVLLASEMGNLPEGTEMAKYESCVVNIMTKLSMFFKNFSSSLLTGKRGIYRKHYYAGRLHFSARQVITSNHEPHQADELQIPWTAAVKLFTEHIRSILLKPPYNYGLMKITDLLRFSVHNYHPIIDEVLTKVILVDTPYKGFPCLFSRPPILTRGSIQFFYITSFNKNPSVNVIKISPLVLVMPNADFDGDQMQLVLLLDEYMHDHMKKMAPAYTILDPDKPNALSDAIKMPPPVIGTINNWFLEGDDLLMEYNNATNNKQKKT